MARTNVGKPSSFARKALVLALCLAADLPAAARAAGGDAGGGAPFAGVSLKIPDASAPPGGALQLDLSLTEAAPILRAWMSLQSGLDSITDAALLGPGGAQSDVAGTMVVAGGEAYVRTTSRSVSLGTTIAAPILVMTIGVPPGAAPGTTGPLALDPASSLWLDPTGTPYPQQVKNGTFQVGGTLSITDAFPGGGFLPAGSAVSVRGVGFQPGAAVEIDGVPVAASTFVSAGEVDATIAAAADLFGRRVRVTNPDGSRAGYFSYLRAAPLGATARPLLAATTPIFSPLTFSNVTFANTATGAQFLALALQNPNAAPAAVTANLLSAAGAVVASTSLDLPARMKISRETSELFGGIAAPAGGSLAIVSSVPVQALGMVGDEAAGTVLPLSPSASTP